jgi:hypothetical protein
VHILRELTFLSQEMELWWAHKIITLLTSMKRVTDQARILGQPSLPAEDMLVLHTQFLALLDEADQMHPRAPTTPANEASSLATSIETVGFNPIGTSLADAL